MIRSTKKSQLAAMKYLAEKNSKQYNLKTLRSSNGYVVRLFERNWYIEYKHWIEFHEVIFYYPDGSKK